MSTPESTRALCADWDVIGHRLVTCMTHGREWVEVDTRTSSSHVCTAYYGAPCPDREHECHRHVHEFMIVTSYVERPRAREPLHA